MGGFVVERQGEVEVGADLADALGHGGFGDAVSGAYGGHRLALQFGVTEGEVEAVDRQAGAGLGADVTHEPASELERLGGVVCGGLGRLLIDFVVGKLGGQLPGVLMQRHRDDRPLRTGLSVKSDC
jgi:hypothetical protein